LALVIAVIYPSLLTWLYFIALADASTPLQRLAYTVGKLLQFALPAAFFALVARQPVRPPWRWRSRLLEGLVSGLLISSVTLVFPSLLRRLEGSPLSGLPSRIAEKLGDLGVSLPWGFLALALFYSLIHTLLEEYYWRWFVFGGLRKFFGFPAALIAASLGFTAHHVLVVASYIGWSSPWNVPLAVGVAAAGAYWAWLYERSGSLASPWLSHVLVDLAVFRVGFEIVS
jgi:membrane protease YdiL (CAAX protease family)